MPPVTPLSMLSTSYRDSVLLRDEVIWNASWAICCDRPFEKRAGYFCITSTLEPGRKRYRGGARDILHTLAGLLQVYVVPVSPGGFEQRGPSKSGCCSRVAPYIYIEEEES